MKEVWKDVVGYKGLYSVSSKGRVKAHKRIYYFKNRVCKKDERLLKLSTSRGYSVVRLKSASGTWKLFGVHRLVAMAFIKKVSGKEFVNHINSDRANNNVKNLEWCTQKENSEHALSYGYHRTGEMCENSKLTWQDVNEIRFNLQHNYYRGIQRDMAKDYGVSPTTISEVRHRKIWITNKCKS